MLKDGIKQNEGEAILRCLQTMGYTEVQDVKLGGIYILSLEHDGRIDEITKHVTNEIMESGEILDG